MTTTSKRDWRDRLGRMARLGVYACVLCACSTWWLKARVSAALGEQALALGQRLETMQHIVSGTSRIELNGQNAAVNSTSTHRSVKHVLDRFTKLCANASGGTTEELQALVASGIGLPKDLPIERFGVLRSESDDQGAAACFARDDHGSIRDLLERMARVAETGDFGQLGQLRYVYARRKPMSQSTHVISVWTQGSLPIERMFPEQGDAPGSDLFEGARPSDGQRLLSVKLLGTKSHMAVYQTAQPAERAVLEFDAPLTALGFKVGDLSRAADLMPVPARVYLKSDDIVLVLAGPQRDNEPNTVAAFRLLNGGYVQEAY